MTSIDHFGEVTSGKCQRPGPAARKNIITVNVDKCCVKRRKTVNDVLTLVGDRHTRHNQKRHN